MSGIQQKIALITGGSRGIGRSTAENLARKGVDVAITYQSREDDAHSVVDILRSEGRKAAALRLDTSMVATFDAFAGDLRDTLRETFGRDSFDYLVNNAGSGFHKPILETTEAEFDFMVNVHFKGVFFLTQKLLPTIADGGRIINLSSGLVRSSMAGTAAYAMAKGGIEVFTRSLATEFGARGITANTVAPGAVATDFNGGMLRGSSTMQQMISQLTALRRTAVADDIGPMIASLLSDENGWINAQRIEVSGGMNV